MHNPDSDWAALVMKLSSENEKLEAEIARLRKALQELDESDRRFRGKIANSNLDCVYCGLSRNDMSKCASGFPGCGRADDIVLDPDWDPLYTTDETATQSSDEKDNDEIVC